MYLIVSIPDLCHLFTLRISNFLRVLNFKSFCILYFFLDQLLFIYDRDISFLTHFASQHSQRRLVKKVECDHLIMFYN